LDFETLDAQIEMTHYRVHLASAFLHLRTDRLLEAAVTVIKPSFVPHP